MLEASSTRILPTLVPCLLHFSLSFNSLWECALYKVTAFWDSARLNYTLQVKAMEDTFL